MAGGSGTRLWPLSRSKYPKQFLKLKGSSQSFFQMAVKRCRPVCALNEIYVVTVPDYEFIIRLQIEEMGFAPDSVHIILEPQPKSTLPAIYNAVKTIRGTTGDDTVIVMASDALITDADDLYRQIRAGAPLTDRYIYTFGIKPTRPETGFGYIMPGEPLQAGCLIHEFKEKPDLETAKVYVKNGYYWNSGMFMFDTALFSEEVHSLAPDVYEAFESPVYEERFEKSPSVSIDYAIMEKSLRTAVLPLAIKWDDVGGFAAFYDTFADKKDDKGNISFNNEILVDSAGNVIYAEENKTCVLVGVNDIVVVDQGDALLVCAKGRTDEVKEAVSRLKAKKDPRAEKHLTEYRAWGTFKLLESGMRYSIMRFTVLLGKQLPEQTLRRGSEHWTVVSGTASVSINGENKLVFAGESFYVPMGARHIIKNEGQTLLEVIDVQTEQCRVGDDAGRFSQE